MFTGLIQGTGRVAATEKKGLETRFTIRPGFVLSDPRPGESIAVNGVCLTAENFSRDAFHVYASAQTISVTSLKDLGTGSHVNLERALALGDRLGGHIVSGHVDCLARVEDIRADGESRRITLVFPEELSPQVIDKGSVALDGVSLTITGCGPGWLQVNIIPATWKETTLAGWKKGTQVNMETDLIGKYVQNMLGPWLEGRSRDQGGRLDMDFLRQHGF
ncbi:riboflavin synthase, alpha subunit [Desulfonatronospira thiodismutans ASO3-1]|uniref:Riboflavin synthase n=1 Tax=Desulfonatronospira thiodismutans ASO3-1 TaxID=555779 RepID=D6SQR1_9BACT|nr:MULTISPECIES: riboflavin synthase [Desulfonatronospira]EFI35087.1 riboflavin synthase, alpha subunit [Desulfonatronospira thiodismutans ASO3-1]RQD73534.1 MAG: riboflavin synthase [Desulfonatronospira sp. MSAO_Bac3]